MRQKFLTIPCILFLAITVLVASCSKEGPAGPAGAAGPAGPAGPAGAPGVPGAAGATGTANVIYSAWIDVKYNPVTQTTGGVIDTVAWVAEIPAPKLTNDILTKGEIKVYFNAGTAAAPNVFPLPLFDAFALTGVFNVNLYYSVGLINLYSTDDASTFTDAGNKVWQYRYILIPGGTTARPAPGAKTVDWNNYKEVQQYLGLND